MQPADPVERWCDTGRSEEQWGSGGILSGDSWKDERVVENSPDSQKFSISKLRIENKNQACYSGNTQINSSICTVSIFTNAFTSDVKGYSISGGIICQRIIKLKYYVCS